MPSITLTPAATKILIDLVTVPNSRILASGRNGAYVLWHGDTPAYSVHGKTLTHLCHHDLLKVDGTEERAPKPGMWFSNYKRRVTITPKGRVLANKLAV